MICPNFFINLSRLLAFIMIVHSISPLLYKPPTNFIFKTQQNIHSSLLYLYLQYQIWSIDLGFISIDTNKCRSNDKNEWKIKNSSLSIQILEIFEVSIYTKCVDREIIMAHSTVVHVGRICLLIWSTIAYVDRLRHQNLKNKKVSIDTLRWIFLIIHLFSELF